VDTLERAAPLLERLGLPATVFATTRWLEEPGEYWWDALECALLARETPPNLNVEIDGRPLTFATSTREERRAAHDALHPRLVHAPLGERDALVSRIVRWSGAANGSRRRPLMSDELVALAQVPGMAVGAHTTNHLALPDQPADVQRSEVVDSLRTLERVLARPVTTFAFPYGAVDRATADLARASCRWSATCVASALGASFDAARVPRLEVKRSDGETLRSRLERLFEGEPA
jgi:peptidoglycan/xylan/chitin deacetylase (PgdA/CDA1 family)